MDAPLSRAYRTPLFYVLTQIVGVTALVAWLAYVARHTGMDVAVTRHFYDAASQSFPLRSVLLVDAVERLAVWLIPFAVALFAAAGAILGSRLRPLALLRPVFGAAFAVACLAPLIVALLKPYVLLSRPFSMAAFGGYIAASDAADATVLPSMHAVAGYVLLCLYFAGWALGNGRLRWLGLSGGVLAGCVLGAVSVAQGSYYLSQVLGSFALVWLLCSVLFYPLIVTRPAGGGAGASAQDLDRTWKRLSTIQYQRRKTLALYAVLVASLVPFIASAWSPDGWAHDAIEWVGLILILMAIAGRCWCMLYLGGRKGAELVDQGPYSVSRNPLYLFSAMAVVGIGAQSGSLLLGVILVGAVCVVFYKVVSEEEQLLKQALGGSFEHYCRRVPRFWPRFALWRSNEHLTVSVSGLWNTLRDALPYFLAIPLFESIEWAQSSGWLPVLIRLP